MGGKSRKVEAPDYSGIIAASERAANQAYKLGKDQLAWAKEQYKSDRRILDRVVNSALERQAVNDKNAASDRARYEERFQPLENELIEDARSFSSPERQEYEAGRASATVAENFEMARQNATRNLESFGVNPASTRFAALDLGARVQQAAAQAGASNQARTETEDRGRAMRSEAINIGRGYPGQIAGTYATALQSGNSGANTQLAGTASGGATMGTGTQWTGLGNQAMGGATAAMNAQAQNQIAAMEANQNASSGLGGLLGVGAGLLGTSTTGTLAGMLFADGGAVPDVSSPSRGKAIDDVDARLTAGEFVVPQDVVSWKGEEFFQKLIDGSRKAKPQAPAQPQYAMVPDRPPSFVSRSGGALPV
jgi:hypothetical protein